MLKALELAGFKSFADKTRFEFPPGITVVVGPNGSGKSNIVDAIKWVLGEQSVKSLRGKEMADVIFNGSGTRRPMNAAEITLTFDNAHHLLAIETPEVHITRRVYRSGEGEYLINRTPARLRDIRDLLSGTGMGTQAYSVIEQGKVDVLLQSSPRDRRVIFEEAAGISRFKARKLESLRRLERVEQNLLRLSDIVDEVESRLRGVRAQAGKARRYKEYADRLQELRTQVGLVDWRRLTDRLTEFETRIRDLTDQRDAETASAESTEANLLEIDSQINEVNEAIRESESRIAANRERIASCESTVEHERARGRDLQEEIARHQRQLVVMNARAGDLLQQLTDTREEVSLAETRHREISLDLVERERELTDLIHSLDQIRGENEQRRAAYMDRMRAAAVLGNEGSALESQVAAAAAACERSRLRLAEFDRQRAIFGAELERFHGHHAELSRRVDECDLSLASAKTQEHDYRQQYAARQNELASLRQRQSATAERAAVLEELHRRHEGLSAGVKEVLSEAQNGVDGPLGDVCGLVADLLNVSVDVAPLIEIALGQTAQHVVMASREPLLEQLRRETHRFAGRVGFVWLEETAPAAQPPLDLAGARGVLGRADRFVETDARFARLAQRLLAHVWLVEKLDDALALGAVAQGRADFVTLAGERLAADGALIVGPQHTSTGLIARRSQLRALGEQLVELEAMIADAQSAAQRLQEQIDRQRQQVERLEAEFRRSVDALAEQRIRIGAAEERDADLARQKETVEAELRGATVQHDADSVRLADARAKREQVEAELAEMEAGLARLNQQVEQFERDRQARTRETTQIKVDLAKSEERLRNLHGRMRQFEENREERDRGISDARERLAECRQRAEASERAVLRAESEIAELYLRKEAFAAETVERINRRESLRHDRSESTSESQKLRAKVRRLDEELHAEDLAANEVRHERAALADRLREDYGIELSELEHELTGEEQHRRGEVQQEIDELRRKIGNLGHVNLEALQELEDLENRFQTLSTQYKDLSDAKRSLEKIIDKINTDSRRLFSETLETVKGHFQKLFRDLFGGGQADIVLDDQEDILESGIEIVARPPGKEPRSISLLSGGEKTLTCVALLLAIFRSRPSPFCVLDEVDAALDEANIDRFTQVLGDFLAWTQFIIVTHSKKTMSAADTLYGVTMQESGVSKQVSVRFEDVSEDGHIRQERLDEARRAEELAGDGTQAA